MSELSPAQLDALEDALEGLESVGTTAAFADPVAERLGDYREILTLSREAFPLVDVPGGVLDGVLAQARSAAAVPEAAVAPPVQEKPWWQRISLLVPALAVVGSAALVLIIVGPMGAADEPASETLARAPSAPEKAAAAEASPAKDQVGADRSAADPGIVDRRLADASVEERRGRLQLDGRDAQRGAAAVVEQSAKPEPSGGKLGELAAHSDVAPSDPAPEPDAEGEQTIIYKEKGNRGPSAPGGGRASKKSGGSKKSSGSSSAPARPKTPAPAPAPSSTPKNQASKADPAPPADVGSGDLMATISAGDVLRRKGQCTGAIKRYAKVRKSSSASIRARALAGIGLCELAAGHSDAAEALFRQARAADTKVASFIASERQPREPAQADGDAAVDEVEDDASVQSL